MENELSRQTKMAWERGFQFGLFIGAMVVLVVAVIILIAN